jgi:hypothetical protein
LAESDLIGVVTRPDRALQYVRSIPPDRLSIELAERINTPQESRNQERPLAQGRADMDEPTKRAIHHGQCHATCGRPDLTVALRQAMQAYRSGRLDEAAKACATVISWDSGHFDAHHLAGVVKLAQGRSR